MSKDHHSPQTIRELLSANEARNLTRSVRAALLSGTEDYTQIGHVLLNFPGRLHVPDDWEQRLEELPVSKDGTPEDEKQSRLDLVGDFLDEITQSLADEMEAWAGMVTDFDRLYCSILDMRAEGVDIWVFDDWGSVDSEDEEVGVAVIPFDIADDLDLREVVIDFYVRSEAGRVAEAVQIIVETLESYGLNPEWDEDATGPVRGPISVRMVWQPHSILKEGWDDLYDTAEEYKASLAVPLSE